MEAFATLPVANDNYVMRDVTANYDDTTQTLRFNLNPSSSVPEPIWTRSRITVLICHMVSLLIASASLVVMTNPSLTAALFAFCGCAGIVIVMDVPLERKWLRGAVAFTTAISFSFAAVIALLGYSWVPDGTGLSLPAAIFAATGLLLRSKITLYSALMMIGTWAMMTTGAVPPASVTLTVCVFVLAVIHIGGWLCKSAMVTLLSAIAGYLLMTAAMIANGVDPAMGAVLLSLTAAAHYVCLRVASLFTRGTVLSVQTVLTSLVGLASLLVGVGLWIETDVNILDGTSIFYVLIALQAIILSANVWRHYAQEIGFIALIGWQAAIGVIALILINPDLTLSFLPTIEPHLTMAALCAGLFNFICGALFLRQWQDKNPVITAIYALGLMLQGALIYQLSNGDEASILMITACVIGLVCAIFLTLTLRQKPTSFDIQANH